MLKGISFLPRLNYTKIYKQAPYEEIDEQKYNHMMQGITVDGTDDKRKKRRGGVDPMPELYCDGDKCVL